MISWFFCLDIAGRVAKSDPDCPWITVAGVAIPKEQSNKLRSEYLGKPSPSYPKFRDSDQKPIRKTFEFITDFNLPTTICHFKRTNTLEKFWMDGEEVHHRMASIEKSKVPFVKPGFVFQLHLLKSCAAALAGVCLKEKGVGNIVSSDGLYAFSIEFILGNEIQGDENKDVWDDGFKKWAKGTNLVKLLSIQPDTSTTFTSLGSDPLLLIPDHVAGTFYTDKNPPKAIPQSLKDADLSGLREVPRISMGSCLKEESEEFALEYPKDLKDLVNLC